MLRQKAREVTIADISSKKIQTLITNMKHTLASTPDGVGLAAPQVGEDLQLFIISDEAEEIDRRIEIKQTHKSNMGNTEHAQPYSVRKWKYYVFINPRVVSTSHKTREGSEGCLSVPGVFGSIKRKEKITMQAFDENGKLFTRGAARFFARVMQHEFDHLQGTLFIDSATHLIKTQN